MKKLLYLLLFVNLHIYAQSVELKPGSNGFVMIPNVSTLGTCAVSDKGKIVYFSTDNSLRMCNGSSWVNISSGISIPFYSVNNSDLSHLTIKKNNPSSVEPAISAYINSASLGAAFLGYAENTTPTNNTYAIHGINYSTNTLGSGVYGIQYGSGSGVKGEILSGHNGNGVYGNHGGLGNGVYGRSSGGNGVSGFSQSSVGGSGVYGLAFGIGSKGVNGYSENGYGFGVYGSAESGIGVKGYALNFSGSSGVGGHFSNASNVGYALITDTGKVGIGNETPNLNVDERMEINGRLRIRDSLSTAGIWFNNTNNSKLLSDGAFHGLKNNSETGFWIGNAWRFWVDNAGSITSTSLAGTGNRPLTANANGKIAVNTTQQVFSVTGTAFSSIGSGSATFSKTLFASYFSSGSGTMTVPVNLPQGVTVTGLEILYADQSASSMQASLESLAMSNNNAGGTSSNTYFNTTLNNVTGIQKVNIPLSFGVSNPTINNATNAYYIQVSSSSWNSSMTIYGATVYYNY